MSYRPDNMRRGRLLDLAPDQFQRTDGKVIGPAPFPVKPDVVLFHGPGAHAEHMARQARPQATGRVSAEEIADSLAGEAHTQYDEPA